MLPRAVTAGEILVLRFVHTQLPSTPLWAICGLIFSDPAISDIIDPQYDRVVVTAGYSTSEKCNQTIDFKDPDIQSKCRTGLFTAINGCKYFLTLSLGCCLLRTKRISYQFWASNRRSQEEQYHSLETRRPVPPRVRDLDHHQTGG